MAEKEGRKRNSDQIDRSTDRKTDRTQAERESERQTESLTEHQTDKSARDGETQKAVIVFGEKKMSNRETEKRQDEAHIFAVTVTDLALGSIKPKQ